MQELREMGISPKRSLGQTFLIDKQIAHKIVRLAPLEAEDIVVEIGPGMGVLTFLILQRVKEVVAVELDRDMVDYLRKKGQGITTLEVVHGDVLTFDFLGCAHRAGRKLEVVANLPYNVSTPTIFRLLECKEAFSYLTLMLQKEVALRITSPPGGRNYGPLSIFTQLYTIPKILMRVPPHAFYPRPRVESALVGFKMLDKSRVEIEDRRFFEDVVRASFAQRRKTILNSLKNTSITARSREEIKDVLESVGIEPHRRAETLDLIEFKSLAGALKELVKNENSPHRSKWSVP
jgi:16S rRNA (adenine1518-N6/adenine1519-N6)-dimethyltransferase